MYVQVLDIIESEEFCIYTIYYFIIVYTFLTLQIINELIKWINCFRSSIGPVSLRPAPSFTFSYEVKVARGGFSQIGIGPSTHYLCTVGNTKVLLQCICM